MIQTRLLYRPEYNVAQLKIISVTDLSHPRLNDPRLVLLRVVEPVLIRERRVPLLGTLEPNFAQSVVDRPRDDVHVRERAAKMRDPAAASDEEGDEDDVRRIHAVVEEDADRHESSRARADLRVEEKDPSVRREMSFADAVGQFDVEEQGFSRFGVGLYEQGAYGHITDNTL